jgi:hypothetical protein
MLPLGFVRPRAHDATEAFSFSNKTPATAILHVRIVYGRRVTEQKRTLIIKCYLIKFPAQPHRKENVNDLLNMYQARHLATMLLLNLSASRFSVLLNFVF